MADSESAPEAAEVVPQNDAALPRSPAGSEPTSEQGRDRDITETSDDGESLPEAVVDGSAPSAAGPPTTVKSLDLPAVMKPTLLATPRSPVDDDAADEPEPSSAREGAGTEDTKEGGDSPASSRALRRVDTVSMPSSLTGLFRELFEHAIRWERRRRNLTAAEAASLIARLSVLPAKALRGLHRYVRLVRQIRWKQTMARGAKGGVGKEEKEAGSEAARSGNASGYDARPGTSDSLNPLPPPTRAGARADHVDKAVELAELEEERLHRAWLRHGDAGVEAAKAAQRPSSPPAPLPQSVTSASSSSSSSSSASASAIGAGAEVTGNMGNNESKDSDGNDEAEERGKGETAGGDDVAGERVKDEEAEEKSEENKDQGDGEEEEEEAGARRAKHAVVEPEPHPTWQQHPGESVAMDRLAEEMASSCPPEAWARIEGTLACACALGGRSGALRLLAASVEDIGSCGVGEVTPLHCAAAAGREALALFLLAAGCKVTAHGRVDVAVAAARERERHAVGGELAAFVAGEQEASGAPAEGGHASGLAEKPHVGYASDAASAMGHEQMAGLLVREALDREMGQWRAGLLRTSGARSAAEAEGQAAAEEELRMARSRAAATPQHVANARGLAQLSSTSGHRSASALPPRPSTTAEHRRVGAVGRGRSMSASPMPPQLQRRPSSVDFARGSLLSEGGGSGGVGGSASLASQPPQALSPLRSSGSIGLGSILEEGEAYGGSGELARLQELEEDGEHAPPRGRGSSSNQHAFPVIVTGDDDGAGYSRGMGASDAHHQPSLFEALASSSSSAFVLHPPETPNRLSPIARSPMRDASMSPASDAPRGRIFASNTTSSLPAAEGYRTRRLKALAGFHSVALDAATADDEATKTGELSSTLAHLGLAAATRLTNRQRASLQPERIGMSNGARALDQASYLTSSAFSKGLPPHLALVGAAKHTHRRRGVSKSESVARAQAKQLMGSVLQFGGTGKTGRMASLGGGQPPTPMGRPAKLEWNASRVMDRQLREDGELEESDSAPAIPAHHPNGSPSGSTGGNNALWLQDRQPEELARALRAAQSLPQLIATKSMRSVAGKPPGKVGGVGGKGYGKRAAALGGHYGQQWQRPRRRRKKASRRRQSEAEADGGGDGDGDGGGDTGAGGEALGGRGAHNDEKDERELVRLAKAAEEAEMDVGERARLTSAEAPPSSDPTEIFSQEASDVLPRAALAAKQRREAAAREAAEAREADRHSAAREKEARRARLRASAKRRKQQQQQQRASDVVVLGSGQPHTTARSGAGIGTVMVSVSRQGARAQLQGVQAATRQLQVRLSTAADMAEAAERRQDIHANRAFDEIAVARAAAAEAFMARHWGYSSELLGHSNRVNDALARRRRRDDERRAKAMKVEQEEREHAAQRRRSVAIQARKARAKEFFQYRRGGGRMHELQEESETLREVQASLAASEMAGEHLGRGGGYWGRQSYSVAGQAAKSSTSAVARAAAGASGVGAGMAVVAREGRLHSVGTTRAAAAAMGGGGQLAHGPGALQARDEAGAGTRAYGSVAGDDLWKHHAAREQQASVKGMDAGVAMGGYQYAGALDPYRSLPRVVASPSSSSASSTRASRQSESAARAASHEEEYMRSLARRRFAGSGGRLRPASVAQEDDDSGHGDEMMAAQLRRAEAEAEYKRELHRGMSRRITYGLLRKNSHALVGPRGSHDGSSVAYSAASPLAGDGSVGMMSSMSSLLGESQVLETVVEGGSFASAGSPPPQS